MKSMRPMQPMKPLTYAERFQWWPEDLGRPDSTGDQNGIHYAYFKAIRRLLLRDGADISTFDTAHHHIQGVAQSSDVQHPTFISDQGIVELRQLKRL